MVGNTGESVTNAVEWWSYCQHPFFVVFSDSHWENLRSTPSRSNTMWSALDWHVDTHSRLTRGAAVYQPPPPSVCAVFAALCNVRTISVCLVRLRDQIRWISWSMTQMFILVSCLSYVSWRMLELAVLSGSPAPLKRCRKEATVRDVGSFNWRKRRACGYTWKWLILFNFTGIISSASGVLLDNNPLF